MEMYVRYNVCFSFRDLINSDKQVGNSLNINHTNYN